MEHIQEAIELYLEVEGVTDNAGEFIGIQQVSVKV